MPLLKEERASAKNRLVGEETLFRPTTSTCEAIDAWRSTEYASHRMLHAAESPGENQLRSNLIDFLFVGKKKEHSVNEFRKLIGNHILNIYFSCLFLKTKRTVNEKYRPVGAAALKKARAGRPGPRAGGGGPQRDGAQFAAHAGLCGAGG